VKAGGRAKKQESDEEWKEEKSRKEGRKYAERRIRRNVENCGNRGNYMIIYENLIVSMGIFIVLANIRDIFP